MVLGAARRRRYLQIMVSRARPPTHVRVEPRAHDEPLGSPYRGPRERAPSLRITVSIDPGPPAKAPEAAGAVASIAGLLAFSPLPPFANTVGLAALGTFWARRLRRLLRWDHRATARDVIVDVDDQEVAVRDPCGASHVVAAGSIAQLFVVERMPPEGRFYAWYGLFARRRGQHDLLLLETPEWRVARYVERAVEERLALDDEPVRGELPRLAE
jgi:hypothetical protein